MEQAIYQILNTVTNDCYIGSSINIKERWKRHKKDLRKQKHHSIILQRAWNKYGENSFIFKILELCSENEIRNKENEYLLLFTPIYNICKIAYSTFGREYKEETRQKHKKYAKDNNIKPPSSTYEQQYVPVIKLDKITGEELEEFKSLSDACFAIGKDYNFVSTISAVCKGKRKSAFGYKWKFK
jgi:group I intron endonuclease